MKAKPSQKHDFITCLASAKKFHTIGKVCIQEYKETQRISPTDIFASATNYGLAVELYLKTLLIMEGATKIHGHHLDTLYEELPEATRSAIEKIYRNMGGNDRQETLYIRGRLEKSTADNSNPDPIRGTKIAQLLKNNRNIFATYRYMFEKARGSKWEYFWFELGNLDLLIFALSKTADEYLSPIEEQKVRTT